MRKASATVSLTVGLVGIEMLAHDHQYRDIPTSIITTIENALSLISFPPSLRFVLRLILFSVGTGGVSIRLRNIELNWEVDSSPTCTHGE